ncbi:leucine-rich repeat-containing protein 52 [Paralichthys olivaceus]|uniref:leucine-rich repeat-containing protein 52 n=1 Tax=Paralichthys olivaceus TaxID=8255 RepID=UPI00097DB2EE|nr:PREDICTED: leucine-rich repeat-containing protein 52-like [Paralichthys olivaceus]
MRLLPDPSAQSLRLLFLFIFVMGVAPSPVLTAGCPDRCVCDDQLVVQCAGQELTQFPNDLPLATRQLIISNNRIGDLPALQLNYLSDLVYLDCSNNSLTEISESTFGNLRKLAYLDLSFNTLLQIEDRTFGPLASLVMLRLTDNPSLSEVHSDAFSENMALQVLDVSRNNLTALNISSLIALPALRSLGLSGNPWRCDCDTEDLCLWVQIEGFKFQDEGQTVCHSPSELAGQRLAEVGMQLRADCHQGLGYWDYLFFIAIGFVIFSAGTVSAWVMGVLMVLYERYSKRKSEELDSDDEDERGGMSGGGGGGSGGGGNQGNGDLSKPGMQV